jgi:hypothetical protein
MTTLRTLVNSSLCTVLLCTPALLVGQDVSRRNASPQLGLEGRVQRVIETEGESIVQVFVQKSTAMTTSQGDPIRFPAPGELVYIHVPTRGRSDNQPPKEAFVRVSLRQDANGQWVPAARNWFSEIREPDIAFNDQPDAVANPKPFGLIAEPVFVGGTAGLKVTGVVSNSPAATAGIEDGDVLMRLDGQPLDSVANLVRAESSGKERVVVTVKDIRTGREVNVAIENKTPPPRRSTARMKPLGITGALAFYQGNPAVKVTNVASGSPASKAGIENGWLVLKANGKAVNKPEELTQAERGSNGTLLLEVFDPQAKETKMVRAVLR